MFHRSASAPIRRLLGICALAGFLSACTRDERAPLPAAPPGPSVGALTVDPVGGRTTSGAIAFANLDASIAGAASRVAADPDDVAARQQLVAQLLTRTTYRGSFDDFDRALAVSREGVARAPGSAAARLLLAAALSATHRFDAAERELDAAESLGASVDAERLLLAVARGREVAAPGSAAEDFQAHVRRAAVLAALGRFVEADDAFVAAAATLRDPSPFLPAWIAFQRGVMWAEAADRPDLGRLLYAEALRRLPGYVVANVHLAELEASLGDRRAAIARLEQVVDATSDPEPTGLLAELLEDVDPQRAAELHRRARSRYDELLAQHPQAFADHGAEFFLRVDARRAVSLALANLDVRQNDRAFVVAFDAADAASDEATACAVFDRLARRPAPVAAEPLRRRIAGMKECE